MNAFIRLLYAVLIAISIVVFVSVSINSLYPGPKAPEYPNYVSSTSTPENNKEMEKQQKTYDSSYKEFRVKEKKYQRNVSAAAVVVAIIVSLGGLWYMRRNEIIGEGLALGGVGSNIYAVIIAAMADHRIMRLVAVTTLLVSALLLVNRRFIEQPPAKKRR